MIRKVVLISVISLASTLGNAAQLLINSDGQLYGANRVDVGGEFWDVRFEDTTCIAAFDGCERTTEIPPNRDFPAFSFLSGGGFGGNVRETSLAPDAGGAIVALLRQVFVDSPMGNFDSDPTLTLGITDISDGGFLGGARIMTPFRTPFPTLSQPGVIGTADVIEVLNSATEDRVSDLSLIGRDRDLGAVGGAVFATWQPSPVPIPAAGYLFLSGLAMVFGVKRLARKNAS